jgi:transcriptional regulator with XRE-family HTH domain
MADGNKVKECAILYYFSPDDWTVPILAQHFGVTVKTIQKWMISETWASVEKIFDLAKEKASKKEDVEWKEEYLQELQAYQNSQKTFAKYQLSLAIRLTKLVEEFLDGLKDEGRGLNELKQVGNFNALTSSVVRLHEISSVAMNSALSIDTLLEAIESGEDPKQLELSLLR